MTEFVCVAANPAHLTSLYQQSWERMQLLQLYCAVLLCVGGVARVVMCSAATASHDKSCLAGVTLPDRRVDTVMGKDSKQTGVTSFASGGSQRSVAVSLYVRRCARETELP